MAHDDENGEIDVDDKGQPRIVWEKAGKQPIFQAVEEVLKQATVPLGGKYMRNPISTDILGNRTVTVHPLGGCGMAKMRSTAWSTTWAACSAAPRATRCTTACT